MSCHRYNASDEADPRSFLTNAYQNRRVGDEDGAAGGGAGATEREAADRALATSLGLALPPLSRRWSLQQLIRFAEARQRAVLPRSGDVSVRRALERLVLSTWVAARAKLAAEARDSLGALGLDGPHECACC